MNLTWRNAKSRLYRLPLIGFSWVSNGPSEPGECLFHMCAFYAALGFDSCCFPLCAVSREDSSQSLASCLNLLPSPIEPSGDRVPGKDTSHRWGWTFRLLRWKHSSGGFLSSQIRSKVRLYKKVIIGRFSSTWQFTHAFCWFNIISLKLFSF